MKVMETATQTKTKKQPDVVKQANEILAESVQDTTQNPQPTTHYFNDWLEREHPLATHNGLHDDEISWATTDDQCKELFAYLVSERIIVVPTLEKQQTEPNDALCDKVKQLPEFADLTLTSVKPASFNQLEFEKVKPYLIALAKEDRAYFNKLLSQGKPFSEIAGIKSIWNKWSGNAQQYALFSFGLDILQIEYEQNKSVSENAIETALSVADELFRAYKADSETDLFAELGAIIEACDAMPVISQKIQAGTYQVVVSESGEIKVTLTSENPYAVKQKRNYNPRTTEDGNQNQLSTSFDFTNGAKCPELLALWRESPSSAEKYADDTRNSKARRVVRLLKLAQDKGITWTYAGTTGERTYYDCPTVGLNNASPTTIVKDIAVHLGWAYNPTV